MLDAWYPGQEGGHAVADVLFGRTVPSGRLPLTFPMHEGQVPLYYAHKPTGRGDDYVDLTGPPLFPFGHGLSYTTFAYRDLTVDVRPASDDVRRSQLRFLDASMQLVEEPGVWRLMVGASSKDVRLRGEVVVP